MNIALAVPIGLLPISAKSSCSAKLVKAYTSLNISDTEYVFKTTREVAEKNLIKGQSEYEIRYEYSAWGSLNRINGKFDATEHFSSSDWTRWQMTCASPQGKSK